MIITLLLTSGHHVWAFYMHPHGQVSDIIHEITFTPWSSALSAFRYQVTFAGMTMPGKWWWFEYSGGSSKLFSGCWPQELLMQEIVFLLFTFQPKNNAPIREAGHCCQKGTIGIYSMFLSSWVVSNLLQFLHFLGGIFDFVWQLKVQRETGNMGKQKEWRNKMQQRSMATIRPCTLWLCGMHLVLLRIQMHLNRII